MTRPPHYPGLAGLELERPDLSGVGVIVTGGSSGIGRAIAGELLAAGAQIVIAARGRARLERVVEELHATHPGGQVTGLVADVGSEDDVRALFAEARAFLGEIGGVVHAAGVLGPIGLTEEVEPAEWLETIRINLFGTFLVARAAVRSIGGRGSIVLLSGGGATSPFPRYTAYASSKAGLVRLVESLAEEVADRGIRVNALAPGFVATPIHEATLAAGERAGTEYLRSTEEQLARGGVPVELAARAALFLLSEESAGISGRLISAPWDRWWEWPERRGEIAGSDLFTLRRIVPRDRGGDWQ